VLKVNAHTVFVTAVRLPGYANLTDQSPGGSENMAFEVSSWGDPLYRNWADDPAVYLLIRDGAQAATTRPSLGGESSDNGTYWRKNQPYWPRKPNVEGLVYRGPGAPPPATQPAMPPKPAVQTRRDLTLDHFRAITLEMSKEDVFALVGPPARDVGYYVHEYDLADGDKVQVNISGLRVEYVRQVTSHGDVWLLRPPR
jgi:hypothetical protein